MSENFPEEESRFTDVLDKAAHLADLFNTHNVKAARLKAAPEQDGTQTECAECGEDIEPERVKLLRCRCFICQDTKEKRARNGMV